jgi:hypothetical protein
MKAFGTTRRLSKVAAHSTGMPSSGPSMSSVGISLTVRVIGAARRDLRTGIAASRVITRKGRRPTSGSSPHQTSPRRGVVTTVLLRSLREVTRGRQLPRPGGVAFAGSPRRSTDLSHAAARSGRSPQCPLAPPQPGSRTGHSGRDRPALQGDPSGGELLSARLSYPYHTELVCSARPGVANPSKEGCSSRQAGQDVHGTELCQKRTGSRG